MKKIVVFTLCYFLSTCLYSQANYFKYHKEINKAEKLYAEEDFNSSLNIYTEVFEKFEYVFLKDLIIAAQIAVLDSKEDLAITWLERAVKNGFDCNCITKFKVLNKISSKNKWLDIVSNSQIYYDQYLAKIDEKLHREFHHRYKTERETNSSKEKSKYLKVVQNNFNRTKKLMNSIPFPSERIIGIDNDSIFTTSKNKLRNCEVANSKVISTLLNQDKAISKIGIEKFIEAIKLGHLHPRQFANIYSFENNLVTRISAELPYIPEIPQYYFNFPFDEIHFDIKRVNQDRSQFGICEFQIDKKKETIAEKYNLKVDFGYK